jgi:hypothetical protein
MADDEASEKATEAIREGITDALCALATPKHGLSPELARKLVRAAGRIPHVEQVAFSCGVAPHTLLWWLRQGVQVGGKEPFVSFARRFFAAEARALSRTTKKIEEALDAGDAPTANARLAYAKWRWGEVGQGGTRPAEALHRILREGK